MPVHKMSEGLSLLLRLLHVLLVQLLLNRFPGDAEDHRLEDIGDETGLQATAKEGTDTTLLDHTLNSASIGHVGIRVGLLHRLDHTKTVGNTVGHGCGADANAGIPQEFHFAFGLGHHHLKSVEGREPWVVSHPVGCEVGRRATVQDANTLVGHLLVELLDSIRTLHLQGGLVAVHRHNEDAPRSTAHRGEGSFDADCHARVVSVSDGEDACVGRSVAKTGDRGLNDGVREAAVETADALGNGLNPSAASGSLLVQGLQRRRKVAALCVLVVHRGAQPHEGHNLHDTGGHPCYASAKGLLARCGNDLTEVHLLRLLHFGVALLGGDGGKVADHQMNPAGLSPREYDHRTHRC
mmetsp:Transcript_32089/g.90994  ORF Transcript_32089/g.90994 Transcript_32089/m.90994 type:complete len:352 (-) Transcript_32089:130-1185(-)